MVGYQRRALGWMEASHVVVWVEVRDHPGCGGEHRLAWTLMDLLVLLLLLLLLLLVMMMRMVVVVMIHEGSSQFEVE